MPPFRPSTKKNCSQEAQRSTSKNGSACKVAFWLRFSSIHAWEKPSTCSNVAGAYQALLKPCFLSRWLWQLTLNADETVATFFTQPFPPFSTNSPGVPSGRHGGHMALREKKDDENQGQGRLSLESAGFTWTKNKELLMEELLHQLTWRNISHLSCAPGSVFSLIYIARWFLNPSATSLCHYVSEWVAPKSKKFWKWVISKGMCRDHTLMTVAMFVMKDINKSQVMWRSEPCRKLFNRESQVQDPARRPQTSQLLTVRWLEKKKTSF